MNSAIRLFDISGKIYQTGTLEQGRDSIIKIENMESGYHQLYIEGEERYKCKVIKL